jgi:large subunit ribosomal protein L18
MIKQITIKQRRSKRVARIRAVVVGSQKRPRLVIYRSHTGLYAQLVDDGKRITLGSAKTDGTNIASGTSLGEKIIAVCKEKGIKQVVFDRGGYKYHGVVKQIADTVRKEGVRI